MDPHDGSASESGATAPAALSLRGASFRYRTGPLILDGVSLDIRSGDACALLGANGSGKSTLLKLLAGATKPESGELLLGGEAVSYSRSGRDHVRSIVQLVLQEPDDQIFGVSVSADVAYGPTNQGLSPEQVRERVEWAMERAEITDLAERVPQQLSYGQRKRVSLAGALAMRPKILLLDEPTAGLDPAGSAQLLTTLELVRAEGTAVLLSTHDVNLAYAFADRVGVLRGAALHVGDAEAVLTDRELMDSARLEVPWAPCVSHYLGRRVTTAAELLDDEPQRRDE